MSDLAFYGALLAIVVGAILIMVSGVKWATRLRPRDDNLTEHGDGEL